MAYRELFTPRLGSSAGNAKRRRRVGPSGPTNWLVLILGRLENIYLFSFAQEPRPSTRTFPFNIELERYETTEMTKTLRLAIEFRGTEPH